MISTCFLSLSQVVRLVMCATLCNCCSFCEQLSLVMFGRLFNCCSFCEQLSCSCQYICVVILIRKCFKSCFRNCFGREKVMKLLSLAIRNSTHQARNEYQKREDVRHIYRR